MKSVKKCNNLSWGLFFNRRFFFRDLKALIRRFFFMIRHGYASQAQWETFAWFIDVMKEILTNYRNNRCGTAIVIEDYWDNDNRDEENKAAYDAILDEMLDCLDRMDESNFIYEDMGYKEVYDLQNRAKDRFFELFSQHFYTFWD